MVRDRRSVERWGGYPPRRGRTLRRLGVLLVVLGVAAYLMRGTVSRWLEGDSGCGWTVQAEVVLDRDLVDCPRHGVRLAPFSVLDCAGHEIRGQGPATSGYGIRIDGVEQAEVRNCRISGFSRGVRIRGGRDNRVIGNQIEGNGYGIEIAGATDGGRSEGHRLSRNRIHGSLRDGIHLGAGTMQTTIEDNVVSGSREEGLAIEGCRGCIVTGNTIEKSGSAAIDLKDASTGQYARNLVSGSLVKVRGSSWKNVFEDNELVESGYVFSATKPDGGVLEFPSENRVVGGKVVDSKVCFRFRGARDNAVRDVEVSGCKVSEDQPMGAIEASGNEVSVIDAIAESPAIAPTPR
jgi:parallel beta-helix repeat protein